ncbi:Kinase D-interacting substrate of 220 kDa [Geodia barretti]|uniref:Kinase D-interacting substrate of 220 kDa n=1 Tax=Geodia barretti TaxID=519541 RepID=A0AA35TVR8_GEOBA|nr:Kinase D-interacting substrate of 220 kDa [Geodia barretti]
MITVEEELMSAVSEGDKERVGQLLLEGVDPNVFPPMTDSTPLMEASRGGNFEIARLLLDNGANPNLANSENWTPLMAAANNGHLGTADTLLGRKADPDKQDDSGWSALMAAVFKRYNGVALRILTAGAKPHIQDKNKTNALLLAIKIHGTDTVVEALLDHMDPSYLDIQDSYGETALMYACKKKNLKLVKKILSMGANSTISNNNGDTAVTIANELGQEQMLQELLHRQ